MTDMTRAQMQLALSQIWETVYDHGQGKYVGQLSRDQRDTAFANITRLRNYVNECAARDEALAGLIAQAVEVDLDKVMRATTRDEKIANPGVYMVPAQRQPLTASTILNLMPSSIPPEYDGALLEFARTIESAVVDAANAKANAAWPLMCEKMVEAEREACAAISEEYTATELIEEFDRGWLACAKNTVAAIRARGQASILGAELP